MQKYHAGSCTNAVNNGSINRIHARDASRADLSAVPPNFSLNSRRSSQLTPYQLRCDKDHLNPRLGPPDFNPQTPNCPEETLTREYAISGYRETVEGVEEARELSLTQWPAFTKPIIITFKCKEAIRKCHRAINESRAQKRKAGQVYEVPLFGTLLTKPGIFPEQRPCGEDFRKKWIEALSQPHKRLRSLADHVPHGYRKKSLFEVLIRNNVPLLRATWFIKITYLNQVRASSNSLSGFSDKGQFSRSEQWTKDVIEYLQHLLDEFIARNSSHSTSHMRNRSSQMAYVGSVKPKGDMFSAVMDGEEPSLYTKWWYVVRIIHWHHDEGLIVPSLIIDWVLNQLQKDKELLGVLQLLLPIIYSVIETLVFSQTYVRSLVGIGVHFIQEPSPGGSDLVDNSRRAYTTSAVVEMLRYLILAVPDTFVALDSFTLPKSVLNHVITDGSFPTKRGDARKVKYSHMEVTSAPRNKNPQVQAESVSFHNVVSSIQKREETLSRAARPNHPSHNVAKVSHVLDQSLVHGDIGVAYKLLFENLCDGNCVEHWIAEVSPCLCTLLKQLGTVTPSILCSIFFICEWATCEFRDFRTAPPHGLKFTGRKDFSQIFIVIRLLKLMMSNMPNLYGSNRKIKNTSDIFVSPGPLHDVIVCWIDQHEVHNKEGFLRLQILIRELILSGIFSSQAYVRQLIVSGIIDENGSMVDLERRKRHYKLLKQLPAIYIFYALRETQVAEPLILSDAATLYSNERRLVLHGLVGFSKSTLGSKSLTKKQSRHHGFGKSTSSDSIEQWYSRATSNLSKIDTDTDIKLEMIKASISALLQLPLSSSSVGARVAEFQRSIKRTDGVYISIDASEETSGCEECRRVKRQKISEERSWVLQNEEDLWWVRKGMPYMDSLIPEPLKPAKQASRGRQKSVRKTQSLAQLAAARIEGSQGASTSHVCESRIVCPHQRPGFDESTKSTDGLRKPPSEDIISVGKLLKQMRFAEKKTVIVWLISTVKQVIEEAEKTTSMVGQFGMPFPAVNNQSCLRWRLGEEELSAILHVMDVCNELLSATRFLLWLLPKIPSNPGAIAHNRNVVTPPRIAVNHTCEVGEAFLISSIRRYENVIVAADLVPDILSATMSRTAVVLASNGRLPGSPAFVYARHLLRKYSKVARVVEWEKSFKSTCDRRFGIELQKISLEADFGFPLGVPNGVEDPDDYIRQKISGVRVSRVSLNMRGIVDRHVDEALQYFYNKDRKPLGSGTKKSPSMEKWDDGYQIAHQIVMGLMECIRQTGGAAQEGDPSLVSSAIAAIVNNSGQAIAKIHEVTASNNHSAVPLPSGSSHLASRVLRIHITCLCILKEALGERQSRVFEVALAMEASSALMQLLAPGKANETTNHSHKAVTGKTAIIMASVSSLIVGAILQGIASLERMVPLFRIKEGLDLMHLARTLKSNMNGSSRSLGVGKVDNQIEVSVNWFRVLVGNCRTVSDGLIVELLGESSILALSRMQRLLALNLVLPPAYSIFAFVIWKPILDASIGIREDFHHMYQVLAATIGDTIKHLPFREICLRDTHGLYDLIATDNLDSEFVSMLESIGLDRNLKAAALVPLRSRVFLDSLIDCRITPIVKLDEGKWVSTQGELKKRCGENVKKLSSKLVSVLDTLQPARFHWQWVELRLLLNEQAVNEKLMETDISLSEAIRSLSNPDKSAASDSEKNFVLIILTRLLVRPDAAPLFSEIVHLLGKSLEDSMLTQVKWLLRGAEVLYGKKSIRQKVINIAAELKDLSMKPQYSKPWGWCPDINPVSRKGNKWKSEAGTLEEGEVDEGNDFNQFGKRSGGIIDVEGFIVSQQHVTEKALIELILPCVDQGSDDLRNNFASELIKQMSNIEQQIDAVTRGVGKVAATPTTAIGTPANKTSNRKSGRSGSPAISRPSTGSADAVPPSPAALRASMTLRLQFLLRLLPIICSDREPSSRNMRYALASVILRLLGSRVVHEDASHSLNPAFISSKRDMDSLLETSSTNALLCGESLFDTLLLILHVLLSSYQPSWLKSKFELKSTEFSKDYPVFDREVAESLQKDLDHMELPETIRWRIQTAMPILFPSVRYSVSCQPPSVSPTALSRLQPSNPLTMLNPINSNSRNQVLPGRGLLSLKTKPHMSLSQHDLETEIDQWTLLEDGTGSGQPSADSTGIISGSDPSISKASNLLKGAVRVRRIELTYVGTVDEDS